MLNLRSATRRKLLQYYFANQSHSHYVRELARLLEVDPTNLSRELGSLATEGLFIANRRGNQLYYELNRGYPFFKEYCALIRSRLGVAETLKSVFEEFRSITTVILYGSTASGREDSHSDIDVLIIGDVKLEDIADTLAKLERQLGREVNPVIYSMGEYRRKNKANDPLLMSIFSSKYEILIGSV